MTLDDLMNWPGLLKGNRILVTGSGSGLGRVIRSLRPLGCDGVHLRTTRVRALGNRRWVEERKWIANGPTRA
jgi:hypothetical protein